jgi:glycosyltransferase involved in cell wall biosynthesis
MERKIKVLQIIKSLGRGGAEMLLPETLRLHNKMQFEFHYIYFLPWKNQMVEAIREHGGKVICMSAKNNIQIMGRAWKVSRYVRENKIDLIHSHLPWAGFVSRLVGKLTQVPVVYTEHNKQERYHVITRKLNLISINALSRIVAVSDDVAASIRKHKSTLKIPLQTILNGVNTERFQRDTAAGLQVRKVLGIPPEAPVIGTVAVFRFQKRLDLWLELAGKILKRNPDCHFIIVGDGPLKKVLEDKRKTLGLEHRVHFTGIQTEVRPYYAAFDIYMMTSVFEGLPIALLEAMSMECAVVTTRAGGIGELIRSQVDGLSVDVNAWESLADGVNELLSDRQRMTKLAHAARQRVMQDFSLTKMVDTLELMYMSMSPEHKFLEPA